VPQFSPTYTDLFTLAIHCALSISVTIFFLAFLEYFIHRYMMHRQTIGRRCLWSPYLASTVNEHLEHHHFYEVFNSEEDHRGKWLNIVVSVRTTVIGTSILSALVFSLDGITGYFVVAGLVAESIAWSEFHKEMHINPKGRLSKIRLYRYLNWLHFLHHQYPDKNFNVLWRMTDKLLGTCAAPQPIDYELFRRQQGGELVTREQLLREHQQAQLCQQLPGFL
jgi:Fatty acid hydroxylase superfamily